MTVREHQRTNTAIASRESQDSVHGFPVLVRPLKALSDDQFHEFCRLNDELQIERTAQGDLLIMAPASFRTSHLNLRIAMQLGQWADRDGTGLATESSGGFILRDSAVVAPDAAWIPAVLGEGQLAAWKESLGADTAKWWRGHLRALRQNDAAGAKRADSGWGSVERAAVGAAWRIPIPAQVRGMVVGTLEVEWPPRHDSERAATSGPDTGATAAAASSCAPAPDPTS